jgi:hypothetical protein
MVSINFPIREKFWPLHRIETVVVQICTNHGKRGCNNPTKTSTPLPSILVLPYSILSNDYIMIYVKFPMSGKFWPLHSN